MKSILFSILTMIFLFPVLIQAQDPVLIQTSEYEVAVDVIPKGFMINPCEIATFDVKITNTGGMSDSYSIQVESIPKDWYTLSHENIDLGPGESQTAYLFITPYCYGKPGVYNGVVSVTGRASDTDGFTMNIVSDHLLKITIPDDISACLCEEDKVTATIENAGEFTEDVVLTVSGDAESFVGLEQDGFTLEAGETKDVEVIFKEMCDSEEGEFGLIIDASSTSSYAKGTDSAFVRRIKCYKFDVFVSEEVQACMNEETQFMITIANIGTKSDDYELMIGQLNFSESFSLDPEEKKDFEIPFTRNEVGLHEISYTLKSKFSEHGGTVTFNVEKCYGVDLRVETKELDVNVGVGKLIKAEISNQGTKDDQFEMFSDITWVSIKPDNLFLASEETGEFYVYYSPAFGTEGTYETNLLAKSEHSQDEETIVINVLGSEIPVTEEETEEEENVTIVVTPGEIEIITPEEISETVPEENETTPSQDIITGETIEAVLGLLGENKLISSLVIATVAVLVILGILYLMIVR